MNKIMYLVLFFALVSCKNEIKKTEKCTSFAGWREKYDKIPELRLVFHVRLNGDTIYFLNEKMGKIEFSRRLDKYKTLYPAPFYILSARRVKCSKLIEVKQIMETNIQCRSGLCGFGDDWER